MTKKVPSDTSKKETRMLIRSAPHKSKTGSSGCASRSTKQIVLSRMSGTLIQLAVEPSAFRGPSHDDRAGLAVTVGLADLSTGNPTTTTNDNVQYDRHVKPQKYNLRTAVNPARWRGRTRLVASNCMWKNKPSTRASEWVGPEKGP